MNYLLSPEVEYVKLPPAKGRRKSYGPRLVKVGTRLMPVTPGERLLVKFSAGAHGKREKGTYAFWAIEGHDQFGPYAFWGRSLQKLSPGDRFDRMERERREDKSPSNRRAYAKAFRLAEAASRIRPATMRELAGWCASHKSDAKWITGIRWNGRWRKCIPRGLR